MKRLAFHESKKTKKTANVHNCPNANDSSSDSPALWSCYIPASGVLLNRFNPKSSSSKMAALSGGKDQELIQIVDIECGRNLQSWRELENVGIVIDVFFFQQVYHHRMTFLEYFKATVCIISFFLGCIGSFKVSDLRMHLISQLLSWFSLRRRHESKFHGEKFAFWRGQTQRETVLLNG